MIERSRYGNMPSLEKRFAGRTLRYTMFLLSHLPGSAVLTPASFSSSGSVGRLLKHFPVGLEFLLPSLFPCIASEVVSKRLDTICNESSPSLQYGCLLAPNLFYLIANLTRSVFITTQHGSSYFGRRSTNTQSGVQLAGVRLRYRGIVRLMHGEFLIKTFFVETGWEK